MAIATINPATGERLCQYPALTDREIDDKLHAPFPATEMITEIDVPRPA